jgi:hypothetical protein
MSNPKVRRIPGDSNFSEILQTPGLTFEDIVDYGFNEVIAEFVRLLDIIKLGSWYLFEYYKPYIYLSISKQNKIIILHVIKIYCKSVPIRYINKFKLGLQCLIIKSNECGYFPLRRNVYDLQLIRSTICECYFNKKDIIKSYPQNVKLLTFHYTNVKINFYLLKKLKYLEELNIFDNKPRIQNICESTDSPNSKEFELSIKKLLIRDETLKSDILKYFKSLTILHIFGHSSVVDNILNLIYFPKSLITFKVVYDLSELLKYPKTPFYEFLTKQVKKLKIHRCTDEDLKKMKSLEILEIGKVNFEVYKLPTSVYYIKLLYFFRKKEYKIQEYLKLLFDNNPNLKIFEIRDFCDGTFLGFKIKNSTFKLNSREEILQAIQFEEFSEEYFGEFFEE